jgi:hypothetical protein
MLARKTFVNALMYVPLNLVDAQPLMDKLRVRYTKQDEKVDFEEDYVAEATVDAANPEIICYDLSVPGYIGVPRSYGIEQLGVTKFINITTFKRPQPELFVRKIKPRDQKQKDFMETLCAAVRGPKPVDIVANARTGCHAEGTLILMFGGTLKPVEAVTIGDLLMGPDSQPRKVLELISGNEEMFSITPKRGGKPFTVNASHILSLVRTREFHGIRDPRNHASQQAGEIINVTVSDYLERTARFKHLHKLRRVGVNFPTPNGKLPISPYFLGIWLGDGHSNKATVTTMDREIVDAIYDEAGRFNLDVRRELQKNNRSSNYHITAGNRGGICNDLIDAFSYLGLRSVSCGTKFIPHQYKCGSIEVRKETLSGLIDSDGSLTGNGYELTFKSRQLADDTAFICRSLGYSASIALKIVNDVTYYRVHAYGEMHELPVRLFRKFCNPRTQKKNPLVTGFSVHPVGKGDYYGFRLDCDHLYLTADFVIHHNTGKTISALYVIENAIQAPTLITVPTTYLLNQWRQRIIDTTGQQWFNQYVGHIQQDTQDYEGRLIVLGVAASLARRDYPVALREYFTALIFDEWHKIGTPSMGRILSRYPASVRIGFTATNRRDALLKVCSLHLGKPRIVSKQEVEKPQIFVIDYHKTLPPQVQVGNEGFMTSLLSRFHDRNQLLCNIVYEGYTRGREIVCLSDRTDQLYKNMQHLIAMGVAPEDIGMLVGAYTLKGKRIKVKRGEQERVAGSCKIRMATFGLFDTGADVEALDMGVEFTPRQNVRQGVGRILRLMAGKPIPEWYSIRDHIMVYPDISAAAPLFGPKEPFEYPWLVRAAKAREGSYADQQGEVAYLTPQDFELGA